MLLAFQVTAKVFLLLFKINMIRPELLAMSGITVMLVWGLYITVRGIESLYTILRNTWRKDRRI